MTQSESSVRCLIVIFGASGDLTRRKLVPSLYELCRTGQLPEHVAVLGVSRTKMSDEEFRGKMHEACEKLPVCDAQSWERFAGRLHYVSADATKAEDMPAIRERMEKVGLEKGTGDNVLFYLAVGPELYEPIIANIGSAELVTEGKRWCSINREQPWQRIIIEKPFGHDLASAEHLNRVLGRVFEDESIFRIDHYLGKETVQNVLVFRFANTIFEPIWNRQYVDHVQITASETVGVEGRGDYYDRAGAMRDMIQSHLLQLMAVVAMEAPNSFRAGDLRTEQRKVLEAVKTIPAGEVDRWAVRGQYGRGVVEGQAVAAYREEPKVEKGSFTETYAALKLEVDNWRWSGVPFFLRTGKRMRRKLTQIVVTFKPTPACLFRDLGTGCRPPNRLVMNVGPDEGISLRFEGKVPGPGMKIESAILDFDYASVFGGVAPEAYATLLLDAMKGDGSLFKDRFEIEAAWRIVMPVLEGWGGSAGAGLASYDAGTWGPVEADGLLGGYGPWRNPEGASTRSKMVHKV